MRPLLAALALATLASCGFKPVYSTASSDAIQVDDIPGRTGHALRKALLRDLAAGLPGVAGGATLTVSVNENLAALAFQSDGAASRSSVRTRARYVLAYADTAVSGGAESEATFNVPNAPYGDISAQVAASDRAARDLSRRIVDDLRLKLAQTQ